MSDRIVEESLIEGLNAYGAHADELVFGPPSQVFAYRAFDLRDRFPKPFSDFRGALEALQSEEAYLPEMSGQIVAYCRDGRAIEIPDTFFIRKLPRFSDHAAAEQWVRQRMAAIDQDEGSSRLAGIAVANPDDPFEKQVADALAFRDSQLVLPEENDQVCEQVARWLLDQLEPSC